MKIAFVSANRETLPDPVIPLGILYVMATLPPRHTTELWDLCFEDDPLGYLAGRLQDFQPDLVAVGLRNIQNNDYTGYGDNLAFYARVVATVRAHSPAPVVLGGGGFSVMPQGLMRHLRPDFGISGEGEVPFAELVGRLEAGDVHLGDIAGLHRFVDGELAVPPPRGAFPALDEIAIPDRRRVDSRYFATGGIDSIQTKRGCPLRCDYCTYPLIEGRSIRQRDPARVVDELFLARERHPEINHVFIVDSVFNLPPAHAKAVCREMIARGFATPWTCYANPLGFDAELATLMAEAGCAGVEIGADSGCNDILDRLRKGFHVDAIERIHALCGAAGVPDCHTFILGTPGETVDHVRRTLDFCRELDPFAAIMMIWTDDDEALAPELAAARQSFREEITAVLRAKEDEFPRWIIPPLGTNFDGRLFAWLRRRGFTGPLWQHIHLTDRDDRGRRLERTVRALPEAYALGDGERPGPGLTGSGARR